MGYGEGLGQGGRVSLNALGQGVWTGGGEGVWSVSTHPTGMHSCCEAIHSCNPGNELYPILDKNYTIAIYNGSRLQWAI